MLKQGDTEELYQNNGDMSCVTGVTGTTEIIFNTHDTKFNIPEEFRHAVDEAQSLSNMKLTATALVYLQDFIDSIR